MFAKSLRNSIASPAPEKQPIHLPREPTRSRLRPCAALSRAVLWVDHARLRQGFRAQNNSRNISGSTPAVFSRQSQLCGLAGHGGRRGITKPQQREHRQGYEENHRRHQERFDNDTGRNEAAQPNRRSPGGFEEKPQTAFLQKNSRSDGEEGKTLDVTGAARCLTRPSDRKNMSKEFEHAIKNHRRRPVRAPSPPIASPPRSVMERGDWMDCGIANWKLPRKRRRSVSNRSLSIGIRMIGHWLPQCR